MKKNTLTTVIIAVIVAAIAFFAGTKYEQTQAASGRQFAAGNFQRNAARGGQGQRGFGGANVGEVVSIDNDSITLKLMDGSSKIVNISGSTTYSKTASASKTDIKSGDRIAAIGTPNSDGSITAQNIQLNPMFRGPGRISPTPSQ
jgi:hypothetical protein